MMSNADTIVPPMRVALVAPLWMPIPPSSYGGTETIVHLLTEGLVQRGHDVTLFAPGDSRTSARLHAVCEWSVTTLMAEGAAHVYDHYANAAFADALRMAEEYDVIHCHLDAGRLPLAAARPADTLGGSCSRVLFSLHTCPTPDDAWALSRYGSVPVSVASQFQASCVPPGRSSPPRVIPHGIDFDAYELGDGSGGYLAYIGRMNEQKGPLRAIEIARGAGMPLLLAGRAQNAEEEKYFEERVRPEIDGCRVKYVGPVDHGEKVRLLGGAAALLFPIGGDEAFGVTVIEAMACGTPVIASSVASAPELVEPGVTGFHAPLAEMTPLVERAVRLDRTGVRSAAREHFGHDRMVAQYEHWYAAYAGKAGRP